MIKCAVQYWIDPDTHKQVPPQHDNGPLYKPLDPGHMRGGGGVGMACAACIAAFEAGKGPEVVKQG